MLQEYIYAIFAGSLGAFGGVLAKLVATLPSSSSHTFGYVNFLLWIIINILVNGMMWYFYSLAFCASLESSMSFHDNLQKNPILLIWWP